MWYHPGAVAEVTAPRANPPLGSESELMKMFLPAGLLAAAALVAVSVPAHACVPSLDLVEYEWPFQSDVSICVWPDGRPPTAGSRCPSGAAATAARTTDRRRT